MLLQYIRDAFDRAAVQQNTIFLDKDSYGQIHANSIDYALLEKAHKVVAIKTAFSWNDMGTLRSVWEARPKDINGNVLSNNAITINTKNLYINSASDRVIAAVDIDDINIIETSDVLLVADRNSNQSIIRLVDEIRRSEISLDNMITEPWGICETLVRGDKFAIKKIKVKPGKNLALLPDHNRGQHWIVTSGIVQVYSGGNVTVFEKNDYILLRPQEACGFTNISTEDLELIEVHSGNIAAVKSLEHATQG